MSSVLIVYDSRNISQNLLQQQYLDDIQMAFKNQSKHGNIIGLQWIDVGLFYNNYTEMEGENEQDFEEIMLNAVDIVAVEVIL